jgi:hypothetical protein
MVSSCCTIWSDSRVTFRGLIGTGVCSGMGQGESQGVRRQIGHTNDNAPIHRRQQPASLV